MPSFTVGGAKITVGVIPRFAHGPVVMYIGAESNLTLHTPYHPLPDIASPPPPPVDCVEDPENPIQGYINYGGYTYALYLKPPVAK